LSAHYGDGFGAKQNGRYLHCAEDTVGRYGTCVHLSHLREVLRRRYGFEQHGHAVGRAADREAAQARCPMLPEVKSPFWNKLQAVSNVYRLSDNARAREALRQCLPEPLRDATFSSVLRDDAATKRCLAQLLINLSDNVVDTGNNQGM